MKSARKRSGGRSAGALLAAALGGIPSGLFMLDVNHRLVLHNRAWLELFGLSADRVRPGLSLTQLCALLVEAGNHSDLTAESLADLYREKLSEASASGHETTWEKPNRGRVIRATHLSRAGIGWIVLHEDITDAVEQAWMGELKEKTLAAQNLRFNAALKHMPHGISMYDADGRLVISNERYREMYGVPGHLCRVGTAVADVVQWAAEAGIRTADGGDFLASTLARVRNPHAGETTYLLPDGRVLRVTKCSMENGGFLSLHQDVTAEVRQRDAAAANETRLAAQNAQFEAALGGMGQGFAMYDDGFRLVICNADYRRMYDLPEALCAPGTTMSAIVAHRLANGAVPLRSTEGLLPSELAEVSNGAHVVEAYRLGSGRIVSISRSPVDGGGFVSIHRDVTREVEYLASITAHKEHLSAQNMRFEAAVDNMSQGLCMFDRDERLVICNEPYARMYDLPADLARPGTPLDAILAWRLSRGLVSKAGHEAYVASRKALVSNAAHAAEEIEMEDGRILAVRHHPMADGGWVATHEDVTAQRRNEAQVRHLARHDALTDLPNRMAFREAMAQAEARIGRGDRMALLCVDLDGFKAVNDSLGHGVGDAVLVAIAGRLRECLRATDFVARLGGDEFVILAHGIETPAAAATIAEKVVAAAAAPIVIGDHEIHVGASIGIALAPGDGATAEALLSHATSSSRRACTTPWRAGARSRTACGRRSSATSSASCSSR